jgi:hypothetical protein
MEEYAFVTPVELRHWPSLRERLALHPFCSVSAAMKLAGHVLVKFGYIPTSIRTSFMTPDFSCVSELLICELGLLDLITEPRIHAVFSHSQCWWEDHGLKFSYPLAEVLIACLKTFYVGEGQYLVVTRHNFQSMLKNLPGGKHNGFKMWLAHQNTELGIECSVGHAVEACVWVLQQLHLVSADFESSRFFPQLCRLWDLIRLEAIDHELLVAAWGNRCLVMINGENPVNKLSHCI